ncbi:general substrate transporter [Xylariaceae sp. FL0594]|nr:general substrate transporter [Xylariaceae sp. FL0594]
MVFTVAQLKHLGSRVLRPKKWFLVTFYISLGGFLNGFDTGSIGSITLMPAFQRSIAVLSPLERGLTVSLLLLAGTIPSLFAGVLADRFGHLRIVLAGAILFTIGAIVEASAFSLAALLVGRVFVGAGEGLYLGNLNVYICEIAPRERRGMLVAMPQALVTLGTTAGYFSCYGTIKLAGDWQWRVPFVIQAIIGAGFALACCLLPMSPRWLIARNRREAAQANMKRLDFDFEEIQHDLTTVDQEAEPSIPIWRGVFELFSKKYRYRTTLGLFILGMVQLCGIDGILYYAPTLFAQAGLPADTASFVASGLSGILMFAISVPAFLLADYWSRRTIVSFGGTVLAASMLVIGGLYASQHVETGTAGEWLTIVFIFIFALTYVSTWGIIGKIYATEIQPAHSRATANALAQALNFLTNFLTAFITPIFLAYSASGPYFLFAGFTLFTLVVLLLYMPETRGRSLEAIQESFHPPINDLLRSLRARVSAGRHGGRVEKEKEKQDGSGRRRAAGGGGGQQAEGVVVSSKMA